MQLVMKSRVIFVAFCWTIAATLCGFQLFYISQKYFRYDTITQVTLETQNKLTLPQLVVCFPYDDRDMYKRLLEFSLAGDNSGKRRLYFNESDIINAMPEILSDHCRYRTDDIGVQRAHKSRAITRERFTKHSLVCYSLQYNGKVHFQRSAVLTPAVVSRDKGIFPIITYVLKTQTVFHDHFTREDQSFYYYLYASQPNSSFYGHSNGGLVSRGFNYFVSYDFFKSMRLRAPFSTNCKNYSESGYESRAHCYERCLTHLSLKSFGEIPFRVLARNDTNIRRMYPIWLHAEHTDKFKAINKQDRYCQRKCAQLDCDESLYIATVADSVDNVTSSDSMTISIIAPSAPAIVSHSWPQIGTIDFFTYVLSCFGFWFGFSPFYFLANNATVSRAVRKAFCGRRLKIEHRLDQELVDKLRRDIREEMKQSLALFEARFTKSKPINSLSEMLFLSITDD